MTAEKDIEITVIIPTYNRASVLKKCLEALTHQTIPFDKYEIIVSDDGSQDDTRKVTEEASVGAPCAIRYLWQPNTGANAARNRAIHASYGRILLFINDDTIAIPSMLEEHLKTHREYPEEYISVLGRMTISPEVPYSIIAKLHLDANFGLWEGKKELNWLAFYTCNVSVKKSFLLKFGLFEEGIRYHEDVELSERLSRHGLKIIYNPDALGYHYHHLKDEEYLNVAKKDGIALAKWYKKSPHLKRELAMLDFPLFVPLYKRLKYLIGDIIFCGATRPLFTGLARVLKDIYEPLSLMIYRKLYQAIKREAIKKELNSIQS